MPGRRDPGLAGPGLLLDQLGRVFARLDWVLPAGSLAEGVPPRAMHPVELRAWLLSEGTGYGQRDAAWAAVWWPLPAGLGRTRRPGGCWRSGWPGSGWVGGVAGSRSWPRRTCPTCMPT